MAEIFQIRLGAKRRVRYINRAGRNLSGQQKQVSAKAKGELRKLYGKESES